MRDSFLAVLAPELVQLPAARVSQIADRARSLGNRTIVRVMEVLGQTLVEMRHAPDARLLLEVAMVKLTSADMDDSSAALTARIAALEERVVQLIAGGVSTLPPAPVDASTGRAKLGGRATASRETATPSAAPATSSTPATETPAAPPAAKAPEVPSPAPEPAGTGTNDPAQVWPQIVESLKPLAKAIFRPATVDSVVDNVVTVRLPNNTPLDKGQQHVAVVTDVLRKMCGAKYSVVIVKDDTNATERPVADKPTGIVEQVEADEFKPIDPLDILPEEVHEDQSIETLRDFFPGGQVEEAPARAKKK